MYDRALEERFNKLDLATIERWIEEKASEDLYIEFKRQPRDDNDLKKALARQISAFGNAAGGICIWGIDAGQDDDGIDRIRAAIPIAEPAKFMSRLVDLSMGVTAPGHAGVQHKQILRTDGTGFVATVVPAFDGQPLMALIDHVYRVRTSKGVAPMEHFQIADMFGKRAKPKLETFVKCSAESTMNVIEQSLRLQFFVRNTGRAPATEIQCVAIPHFHFERFSCLHGWDESMAVHLDAGNPLGLAKTFVRGVPFTLHPQMSIGVCFIDTKKEGLRGVTGMSRRVRLVLSCSGAEPTIVDEVFDDKRLEGWVK